MITIPSKINNSTPFLVIDLSKIRGKYRILKDAFPDADIYYAMKANPSRKILKCLYEEGCGIEFASEQELDKCLQLGFDTSRLITANPIKTEGHIKKSHENGVRTFVLDSFVEADKIRNWAPTSQILIRITVDNTGSDWPLTKKFGVDPSLAVDLIEYAGNKGLKPIGLTFHVGSQCLNVNNWSNALYVCMEIMRLVKDKFNLSIINLGGGFPIKHIKKIPSVQEISATIKEAKNRLFNNEIKFQFEPGRFLIGDCGIMVASVIGKAKRGTENWLYLDLGLFNGLMEAISDFQYEFFFDCEEGRKKDYFTIAGPTCDSFDTMFRNKLIPELKVGERFYILNAGAYTTAYEGSFNGFSSPKIVYIENGKVINE